MIELYLCCYNLQGTQKYKYRKKNENNLHRPYLKPSCHGIRSLKWQIMS
jgi:hypothetical protein